MRKPLIAANWKMHGMKTQINALISSIKEGAAHYSNIDVVILPSFIHLGQVGEAIISTTIKLGEQNLYLGGQGAYTGEVSAPMLADMGCEYVLVGHSERRTLFHETNELVAAKFKTAISAGIMPILCIGETQTEREQGKTEDIIYAQLQSVIDHAGIESFKKAVIAYEPVWAIGTGLTATPEQAEAVHQYIRTLISKINVDIAETIRILYGGSVKADNAAALLAMPNIDGGLIGGASLEANSFLNICAAADEKIAAIKMVI